MKALVYILSFFLATSSLKAQSYFNKVYDYIPSTPYNNAATTCYEMSNGDYLVSGIKFYSVSFGSLFFIRINSNGDTLYSKRYPRVERRYNTGASGSLIRLYDGNFVQSGSQSDSSANFNALLVKLTDAGDTLWTRTYGGSNFENANIVCQTSDKGFALIGCTQSFSMGAASDFYLVKTDSLGNLEWQQSYGTTGIEEAVSGQITLDGGYILSGHRGNVMHIVKTDSLGSFQWQQTYTGTKNWGFITQLPDSTYLLAGAKAVVGLDDQACLMKLSKTGGVIWQKTYGGSTLDLFSTRPVILNDGSIAISGITLLGSSPIGLLVKTDSAGNQLWLRNYYANAGNDNYVYDMKQTSDNGFILVGSGNITGQDAWVVKVDSLGCEVMDCSVGMEEFKEESSRFRVFPNPSSDFNQVEIRLGEEVREAELLIYNLLGMELQHLPVRSGELITVDTRFFNNGIYIYALCTEQGIVEKQKIIVSH